MKSINRSLFFIIPVVIIIPFLVIAMYNHPALDDWWYAAVYKRHGLIGAQAYWYSNYTARFFSNFAMTLAPLSFDWIEGHKVMPIVFIGCLFFTLLHVSGILFKGFTAKKYALALWLTATYLLIQRDYFESIYWLSANVVYQFNMLFFMLHLTVMYRIFFLKEYTPGKMLLAIALSIAVTGSNETLGGLMLAEAFLFFAACFFQKRLKSFAAIFLFVQLICWTVMLIAPGNWSKIGDSTQEHVYTFFLWKALWYSFLSCGYYSLFLLKQPAVWCLALLALPAFKFLLSEKLNARKTIHLLLFAGTCFSIAFAIYFISIFPTGILLPPLRVTDVAVVFLFSGFALLLLWLSQQQFAVEKMKAITDRGRNFLMIGCIVFAIITPAKYRQMLADLASGRAQEYDKILYERYAQVKSSTADTCFVKKIVNPPGTIMPINLLGEARENLNYTFGKCKVAVAEK